MAGEGGGGLGGSIENGRPTSRGWRNFGRRWTSGVGSLENWTIFMDFMCVLSLQNSLQARIRTRFCFLKSINLFCLYGATNFLQRHSFLSCSNVIS